MVWIKYQPSHTGECTVMIDGMPDQCHFTMGMMVTGKQQVFKAHYILISLPSGNEIVGEDQHNVRDALRALARTLGEQSIELQAIGLSKNFSESGLSHNSGYGYVEGYPKSLHMMEHSFNDDCSIDASTMAG